MKEDKRPEITIKDVERFLWNCSDKHLIKVLLWTVAEVCLRFYNREKREGMMEYESKRLKRNPRIYAG